MTVTEQFVEKYNLRQKKYIDLSFVGDAYDYATFELAVSDINASITTNALTSGTGAVRVFKGEEITVIRLLQDVELTTQNIIRNNAIVDFNGFTISKAEGYTGTYFLATRWTEGKETGVVFYARNGGNIRTSNVIVPVGLVCEYSALIGITINSNYDSSYSANNTTPLPIRIGNYTEDSSVIQKVVIEDCRIDASAVGETTVSKSLYGVYDYNYKATELIMSNTKITINNEVFDDGYPHIVYNVKSKIDNIFKLINCQFVYTGSVSAISIGIELKSGHLTMIDCYIKTESSVASTWGLSTGATTYIRNSDIIALSPDLADKSAVGFMNMGIAYLKDTNVFGVTSGIQNNQTLYVNGGYLRAAGHGGLYNSDNTENTGAKAYLSGVTLAKAIDELQEFGATCSNSNGATYSAYGCYTWFDNCTFKGARVVCKYATDETDDTDRGATVYISNSYSELGYRCDPDTVLTLGTGVTGSTSITGTGTVNYTDDDFSELVKVDVPSEFYGTIGDYLNDLHRIKIDLSNLVDTDKSTTFNTLTNEIYSVKDVLRTSIEDKEVPIEKDATINTYASKIGEVYNAGFEKGKAEGGSVPSEFEWAKHTINKPLFNDDSWATENTVIYMPNVSNISEIFYNKKLTKIKTLTVKTDVPVTNANYFLKVQNDVSYAFLERLILECDFSQCAYFNQFLQYQRKLVSIEGQPLNLEKAGAFSFSYLEALESFRVERETIKDNFSIAASSNLDSDTIQSIVDGLADLTGGDAKTLILHSTVKGKLTETQLATITGKNWTLA